MSFHPKLIPGAFNSMSVSTPCYSILDHTADLGIKVTGSSKVDLFKNAAEALLSLMLRNRPVKATGTRELSISGYDLADIMVRWLSEILYLFEGEGLVVTGVVIESLSSMELRATLWTSPFDANIHEIIREIKAVTYHQIEVIDKNGIWEAVVILDL